MSAPKLLLSLDEAGQTLGGISAKSVMRLIASGDLQACDVGTSKRPRTRVPVSSLEDYVRAHSRTAPKRAS